MARDAANASAPSASSKYVYNKEPLGFRLDSEREIAVFRDGAESQHEKVEDFFDYTLALSKSIMNVQNNQRLHSDDWHRTVYINTLGVSKVDFGLKDDKKAALVAQEPVSDAPGPASTASLLSHVERGAAGSIRGMARCATPGPH